jgi:hypothetical protein
MKTTPQSNNSLLLALVNFVLFGAVLYYFTTISIDAMLNNTSFTDEGAKTVLLHIKYATIDVKYRLFTLGESVYHLGEVWANSLIYLYGNTKK